ncbi:MAG TPA: bifunctional DNA-formamidopyrimidine glycosylase/DNA-(apurinic or apyrimidinic site) lyase [Gemmatimonadaceae bacterium]|nr:bifunctional DNA-formamidopyrimidine glycosylase/DNA-(apurinic or apyrimidinic site) lyase [Gemmatimonadaceae bacterium]
MPELPEVEHAARQLERSARGRMITRLEALHPALRRRLPPRRARRAVGTTVERVERRGKHQLVHLASGDVLHVHFRMTGEWVVGRSAEALPPYARAVLELDDGTRVTLADPRALSTITLGTAAELALPPLAAEPLDSGFSAATLGARLSSRSGSMKPALLDQRVVAGLGNIYAVEALWRARIDPRTCAARLGVRRLTRLAESIREVIRDALDSPARYSDAAARPAFAVYDREGEPCPRCGSRVRRIVQAGRSTFFCGKCQRL